MDTLTTEINGIKYLLIETLITNNTQRDKYNAKLKELDCIYQGVKELRLGFFSSYVIAKTLVPETNITKFNEA